MRNVVASCAISMTLMNCGWSAEEAASVDLSVQVEPASLEVTSIVEASEPIAETGNAVDIQILSFSTEVQPGGDEDLIYATSGPIEDADEVHHFGAIDGDGVDQVQLESAGGLSGLPNLRSLFGGDTLRGEHRDQLRLERAREVQPSKKMGLISLFRRGKPSSTVQPVSERDKARAQAQAKIDRLRDEAVRTGNVQKMDEADRLQQALQQTLIRPVSTNVRTAR